MTPELRAEMRAAVEHLWDGIDEVSPNLQKALRRVALDARTEQLAA